MDENKPLTPEIKALMNRSQTEIDQENWHDASQTLSELYESLPTFEVNYKLVTTLFMDEQYQLAGSYADDFLGEYLEYEDNFRMLVALSVKTQNFVYAHQLIMLWDDGDDGKLQQTLLNEVKEAENKAKDKMAATFQTISRQFYHMSDYDIAEQRSRYESARHLPVADFIKGARFLLLDPYTLPVIRATLLDDLQKLNINEVIQYRWLDNDIYTVNLSEINALTDNTVFLDIANELEQQVGQNDPNAMTALTHELRLELTLLYPRIAEVITDAKQWVAVSLSHYYQRSMPDEPKQQSEWHHKVLQMTMNIFKN
ncbi:hypothetical protein [Leuconostoc fallax]|uniref:Type I restriction endonuclease subunit R n=1 Tax=Leuconostoc fallax TaxID=1251 RepID=A0A4R5N853_9LACO|nr:hypothetical protein [Leuconostoc fallax]MBU7455658.1 type I restriction endonuclease subunit R [Leuconostoc fallax]MCO6183918.1 type I restriction endonuclease subunit R [Leuconostoc fallax]TDG68092.1 hypothetical protein C5L23_000398 [Leuconostoc fallax]